MKKILIIDSCYKCPFYDNVYYSYNEKCTKLDQHVSGSYITVDCPLNDAPDGSDTTL